MIKAIAEALLSYRFGCGVPTFRQVPRLRRLYGTSAVGMYLKKSGLGTGYRFGKTFALIGIDRINVSESKQRTLNDSEK
jgi:hypothetical protein